MAFPTILAGLLLAPAAFAAGEQYAQLTIRQRVIVRIQTAPPSNVPPRIDWREHKGPKCLPMAMIQGAAVIASGSVDLIMRGGSRMRARFAASCPALDYYSGFYVAPSADGRMCAGRDSVRDRAGGVCEVARFRLLKPKR
jgi:hypothetical protein